MKKLTALTDDANCQLELFPEDDTTYDAEAGYALLSGTQLPPVLRQDEMEI